MLSTTMRTRKSGVATHLPASSTKKRSPAGLVVTGRNFLEILRAIDSMQLTAKHKVATPANWKKGEDVVILPAVKDEEAKKIYPNGWETVKPYLRKVPDPSK